VLSYGPFFFML